MSRKNLLKNALLSTAIVASGCKNPQTEKLEEQNSFHLLSVLKLHEDSERTYNVSEVYNNINKIDSVLDNRYATHPKKIKMTQQGIQKYRKNGGTFPEDAIGEPITSSGYLLENRIDISGYILGKKTQVTFTDHEQINMDGSNSRGYKCVLRDMQGNILSGKDIHIIYSPDWGKHTLSLHEWYNIGGDIKYASKDNPNSTEVDEFLEIYQLCMNIDK